MPQRFLSRLLRSGKSLSRQSSGKLEGDPKEFVESIGQSGFRELAISAHHAAKVYELPLYHRDPFDRLLIAQAIFEPLRLLTADNTLAQYSDLVMTVQSLKATR